MSGVEQKPEASAQSECIARPGDDAQLALRKLGADVEQHESLSATHKQAIGSLVDNLDEQIALAQDASRETLTSARSQLRETVRKMHNEVNGALGEMDSAADHVLRSSVLAWTRAMDKLEVELEQTEKRLSRGK